MDQNNFATDLLGKRVTVFKEHPGVSGSSPSLTGWIRGVSISNGVFHFLLQVDQDYAYHCAYEPCRLVTMNTLDNIIEITQS